MIQLSQHHIKLGLRFFTYGIMTLAVIVLTCLTILYAMGYRFDQANLTFNQGGLVQFRTVPDGAYVSINGINQNFRTPGRSNVPAGKHKIEMSLPGYNTWRKTVTVQPGQLLWLNYTRFVPSTISTTQVRTFTSLAATLSSPDRKWIALQEKDSLPIITFADISDPKKPTLNDITIPETQITKTAGSYGRFSLVAWDADARYVLVKQERSDGIAFIRVDRTRAENAVNISRQFGLSITDAYFGSNANTIFTRTTDAVLRRFDISAGTATAALVTGVQQFSVFNSGDVVAYVAVDSATSSQNVGIYADGRNQIIRNYPLDKQLLVAYSRYLDHSYVAIRAEAGVVQILRDPTSGTKDLADYAHFDLGRAPTWLDFSDTGRVLVAGAGNEIAGYDIEVAEEYHRTLAVGADITAPLDWLDDYHVYTDAGGRLRMLDFDGQNNNEITTAQPGFTATLAHDGKMIFSIGRDERGLYSLQASSLVKN